MRSDRFTIPGTPNVIVEVSETDQGGIRFELSQSDTGVVGDLRGLFFDVNDPSVIPFLNYKDGDDVTGFAAADEGVLSLGLDNTMAGEAPSPYDVGVAFGTLSIAQDDIQTTSFVLYSSDGDLSLDLIANVEFGARLSSVGVEAASAWEGRNPRRSRPPPPTP